MSIPASSANASAAAPQASKINPLLRTGKDKDGNDVGEDHFSFKDVLDIINPLQHIPIINNIYRKVTGDEIGNGARIAGGAIYGGVIGAAFGIANAIAVNETGNDIGDVALTKMGLIKSQEVAQQQKADIKDLAVVEIHPSDKNKPVEDAIFDKPVDMASNSQTGAEGLALPSPKDLNAITTGGEEADNAPLPPVTDPSADPSISKADIQKNMLAGLDKYNALQKSANPGLIVPPVTAQTAAALDKASAARVAKKNIFALPAVSPLTNLAASSEHEADDRVVASKKKPTAAFNNLRHYSN